MAIHSSTSIVLHIKMSLTRSSSRENTLSFLIIIFITITLQCYICKTVLAETSSSRNFKFSRDHVSVWFDSPLLPDFRNRKPNLEAMVNLVSNKFETIAIDNAPILPRFTPIDELTNNRLQIPSVVADHNKNSGYSRRMKVMVSFDLSPSSGINKQPSYKNSFDVAKYYADQANKMFPGTVETLLLHHDDYLRVNAPARKGHEDVPTQLHSAWEALNQSRSDSNATQYYLGVTISLDVCGNDEKGNPSNSSLLAKFVKYADIIIPVVHIKKMQADHKFVPEEEHSMQVAAFENCQKNVKKLAPEVTTIPLVICNTPHYEDGFEFFQCWQLMNDYAVGKDQQVILYEAFDKFEPDYVSGAGWWRLKNEAAQAVTEDSFLEKVHDDLYKSNIKTDGITAVVFNHRVRYVPRLTSYSEPEVKSMLELVSTRFSTIVTGHKPYTTKTTGNNTFGSRDYTFIPEIVARLNAENAKKSDFQQLTVIFTFFRPDNDTLWDADSTSTDSLLTLDVVMEMSRLANSIYPKTVSTLVFHKFSASEQIWSFVSSFSKLKTTLGSGYGAEVIRNGFQLGTVIDLSVCRRHMALLFIEIKAWVKLFIIDVSESSISAHQYPDSLMRSKIKAASECRTVYKQLFPEADVMVSVNCSEIVRNTTTRMADMALCAHMISEWGDENQVEIIFSQAFDLPHGSAGGNTKADPNGGWWKLARKSELNITKDSFVEKIDEFYGISGRITDFNERFWETRALYAWKDDGNDSSNTGYVVTIVILVLMCVFLTFLSMYYNDRDRFTGVFQRLRNDSSELQLLG